MFMAFLSLFKFLNCSDFFSHSKYSLLCLIFLFFLLKRAPNLYKFQAPQNVDLLLNVTSRECKFQRMIVFKF